MVWAILTAIGTVYAVVLSMCSAAKRADEHAERQHPYQRWCAHCSMLTEHHGSRCPNERFHGLNLNCATWQKNPATGQFEADPHTMHVLAEHGEAL